MASAVLANPLASSPVLTAAQPAADRRSGPGAGGFSRLADSPGGRLTVSVPPDVDRWLHDGMVTANVGFDLEFEARQLAAARRQQRRLLSIRVSPDEALIGPLWVPGDETGCAGCAESRLRQAVDHPLLTRPDINASPRSGWPPSLAELVDVGLDYLGHHRLASGEMLAVGLTQSGRHRVARSNSCPLCGPPRGMAPTGRGCLPDRRPEPLVLQSRPSADAVPLRGPTNPAIGEDRLARLVDGRVGPVLQVTRYPRAPFAMSGALVPAARAMGHGRSRDFARSKRVAILEAYERLGAFPHQGQVIQDLSYDQVREFAVNPAAFGSYSRAQLDHPNARVRPWDADQPMDWAYGFRLDDGEPWLVPADIAFYGYEYQHRLDEHGARRDRNQLRRAHFFAESSSGCALGSSLEEAALHGLLELIERDAFLMAWGRRVPLPAISHASVGDPTSQMLLQAIHARGFDVHLLATTYDLGLPSVWALGVNRDPYAIPATFSAAGSNPAPEDAVRAALWELAQIVAEPLRWDRDRGARLLQDPSLVDSIDDHVHLYALPEMRDRIAEVLGGPTTTMADAFPGWPEQLCRYARGDVRGSLDFVRQQCRAAGLAELLVVDQSTREHRDLGLAVARAIVPGMLPMCFGSPQQRLRGLPRRDRALAAAGRARDDTDLLCDPHPFP